MNYNDNRLLWSNRIAAFKQSDMNQVQWCKANEVSLSALRYWLRKSNVETNSFVQPEVIEFASLDVPAVGNTKSIVLEVGSVKIHLDNSFNEGLLLKTSCTFKGYIWL